MLTAQGDGFVTLWSNVAFTQPDDQSSLVQVYQEHVGPVFRFLYSRVGNREDAEDMASQVFLKAVRHLDLTRDTLTIRSWLFQLARTAMADYWREYYKAPRISLRLIGDISGPDEEEPEVNPGARAETLRQVLEQLPDHYRRVLTLRFLEALSIKETAAEMGLTEGNVKVLQLRALRKAAERGSHLL